MLAVFGRLIFSRHSMKKCLIFSENKTSENNPDNTYRNVGAMEVVHRFRQHNIPTTHIEWFNSWSESQLTEAIDLWFSDSTHQYIGISTPFSLDVVFDIKDVLLSAKERYPNLQILVGGNRVHDPRLDIFTDLVFIGRSIEILDAWLTDQDLHRFATANPNVLINHNVDLNKDVPVLPVLSDDDLLTDKDVLGFEIGIGCKFNCSFCSYDLRGIKNPKFVDSENLREFLQSAYDRYGVYNFYIADDTLNEDDEKLEILAEAVEALTYEPNIVSFLRIDLLERRPQQYELLRRCNLKGLTLGIETLTPAAAKIIRKSPDVGAIVTALRKLKNEYLPKSFTTSGLIIGLSGDSREDILKNIDLIVDEVLLYSMSPATLRVRESETEIYDDSYLSDIALNPEKFGYTIRGVVDRDIGLERAGSRRMLWENEWTNETDAERLTDEIVEKLKAVKFPLVTGFEWITLMVWAGLDDPKQYKQAGTDFIWQISNTKVRRYKQNYIQRKLDYLRENVK